MSQNSGESGPGAPAASANVRAEEVVGVAWDKCAEDLILKFSTAVLASGMASAVLFKRPMAVRTTIFGAGVGVGTGIESCQNLLKQSKVQLRERKLSQAS